MPSSRNPLRYLRSRLKPQKSRSSDEESVRIRASPHVHPIPQTKNLQLQSTFFSKLPLEIRILIYKHLIRTFGWGETVHIVTRSQLGQPSPTPWGPTERVDLPLGQKLAYIPCAAQLGDPFQISGSHYGHWPRGHLACERIANWQTSWPSDGPKPKDFTGGLFRLALFLSCKRMYVHHLKAIKDYQI
jgi:hypothetical protein